MNPILEGVLPPQPLRRVNRVSAARGFNRGFMVAERMVARYSDSVRSIAPSNFSRALWHSLMVLLFMGGLFEMGSAQKISKLKNGPGAEFFTEPQLQLFQLEIPEAALNQLRQSPRIYVTGQVTTARQVLTNVGIRLRGHGSFRSLDEKPNFAINFRAFATNQTYRGLKKLMFNNSVQDTTGFAEFLSTQLFRDAGLPAARVTHARVQLNGRDLGLYVVVETMGSEFLKQHFKNPNGNLYEGGPDLDGTLEQDSGVRGEQLDRMKLAQACAITNRSERWRVLGQRLEVNQFVSFAAMEMLTAHWDGYVLHVNNFRTYHDPGTDRFAFIAHGMDWTFLRPNLSIQVPQRSVVGRAVFDTPEGQKLYRERVGTLFTNVFRLTTITNRIEQELAKIRTGRFSSNDLARIDRGAALMRERIVLRATRISNELAGVGSGFLKFDTNGLAALIDWRADHDGGTGAVDRAMFDGKPTLHIGAVGVNFHPSWRALVYLPPGSYRYEGTLKIAAAGPVTAILRTSGPWSGTTFRTATDWLPLTYDFEVKDATGNDVEFVCDFSGAEGAAWFDLNSMRVRRLTPEKPQ